MPSPFSWISMEGFFAEKPDSNTLTTTTTTVQQIDIDIDLTLKLSPCGQNSEEEKWLTKEGSIVPWLERSSSPPVEEAEKGPLMRFGELQTMRRVRSGKRLLLENQRRAAAAASAGTDKSPTVSQPPPAGGQPPPSAHHDHAVDKLKRVVSSYGDSLHDGEANSNIKTSTMQGNDSMIPPKALMLENPAKKLKPLNPILREMPNVTTRGDGSSGGKRIEGLLYKYRRGQVCIVCVCHGSFLSPAEFVMHAGGKEVANPMKHITVCSNSF